MGGKGPEDTRLPVSDSSTIVSFTRVNILVVENGDEATSKQLDREM
jgi:hypothetical protein